MDLTFLQIFLIINVFLIGVVTTIAVRHAYVHFRPHAHESDRPSRSLKKAFHLPAVVKERLIKASEAQFQAALDRAAEGLAHDLKVTATKLDDHLARLGTEVVGDELKRYHEGLEQLRRQNEAIIFSAQTEMAAHQADLKTKLAQHMAELETKIGQREAEIEAKVAEDVAAERQRLNQEITTERQKLNQEVATERQKLNQEVTDTRQKLSQEITSERQNLANEVAATKQKLSDEVTAERQRLTTQINTKLSDAVASFLTETLQHKVDLGAQSEYLVTMLEDHKGELLKEVTDEG